MPRILVFAGSIRTGSVNEKLAVVAASRFRAAGADVTHLSLRDYPLPIYDGDLEANEGVPENARRLKAAFEGHEGVFIASPEYNSGYSPLLKNALDWTSRLPAPGVFQGRVTALGAVGAGAFGGYRGLTQLRSLLELGFGAFIIPDMVSVSGGNSGFAADGSLAEERPSKMLDTLVARLMREAGRIAA